MAKSELEKFKEKFPNFFAELNTLESSQKDIDLVEGYIQSVLDRLLIPHIHEGKTTNKSFFKHLSAVANEYAQENDIEIDLYIGGGVVRTLLASMYKFVHERKSKAQEKPVTDIQDTPVHEFDPEIRKAKARMLTSTEFHLKQAALGEKEDLLSPFVLGVGSDLDIYYEVKTIDGKKPTEVQVNAGKDIARNMEYFINRLENENELRKETDPMKHSLLAIADIKEYNQQITRVLEQGGSMLDTLGFKINAQPSRPKERLLRHPKEFAEQKTVIRDFLHGTYEYVAPKIDMPTQKQAIRGLRPLLEMPFIKVKDQAVIVSELKTIIDNLRINGAILDSDAVKQFDKMLRNANFQGAGNRAYFDKESPIGLGLEIAEEVNKKARSSYIGGSKLRYLMPEFLQKMPIVEGEALSNLQGYIKDIELIPVDDFIKNNTDNGVLYHGTSVEAGMNILRGGFVMSTMKSGMAVMGPGVYASHYRDVAYDYSGNDGVILPIQVQSNNHIRVTTIDFIIKNHKTFLDEAKQKGFWQTGDGETEAVYKLLRDREQYAIDIIVGMHVVVQNQSALNLNMDLRIIHDWYVSQFKNDFNLKQKLRYDSIVKLLVSIGVDSGQLKTSDDVINEVVNDAIVSIKDNSDSQVLLNCIDMGLADKCSVLIDAGVGINAKNINGDTALIKLLIKGGKSLVKGGKSLASKLIDKNINLNEKDISGRTAIEYAIYNDFDDVVLKLIDAGADVSTKYKDPLDNCLLDKVIKKRKFNIAMKLIENGAYFTMDRYRNEAFNIAVQHKQYELALMLIEKGFRSDCFYKDTALMYLASKGYSDIAVKLVENGARVDDKDLNGTTALMVAAKKSHIDLALKLIELGAKVNETNDYGETALMVATDKGNIDLATKLVGMGANIDEKDRNGKTALMVATDKGNIDLATKLVGMGANIDEKDRNGTTALMVAAEEGHIDLATKLVGMGANIDEKDLNGTTALMVAAKKSHIDLALKLIELGAKVNETNDYGKTALMVAAEEGHIDLGLKLIELGAKIEQKDNYKYNVLTYAVNNGRSDLALKLIELGACLTEKPKYGESLLMVAAKNDDCKLALKLIEIGASIDEEDYKGRTALDYALSDDLKQQMRDKAAEVYKQQQERKAELIKSHDKEELENTGRAKKPRLG